MTNHTTNPCARQIMFAGEVRTFNLNDAKVLALIEGGVTAMKSEEAMRRFMMSKPLAGQFGDTVSACLRRFLEQVYSHKDVANVIALGLIGGGMSETKAFGLVDVHVVNQPLAANALIASEVISALFVGMASEAA